MCGRMYRSNLVTWYLFLRKLWPKSLKISKSILFAWNTVHAHLTTLILLACMVLTLFDLHTGVSFLGVVVSAGLISTILFTICPCVIIIIVAVIVVRSNRRRNVNVITTTVAPPTTISATSDSYSQVDAFPLIPPASAPPDPSVFMDPPKQPAPPYSQDPPTMQGQLYEYNPSVWSIQVHIIWTWLFWLKLSTKKTWTLTTRCFHILNFIAIAVWYM